METPLQDLSQAERYARVMRIGKRNLVRKSVVGDMDWTMVACLLASILLLAIGLLIGLISWKLLPAAVMVLSSIALLGLCKAVRARADRRAARPLWIFDHGVRLNAAILESPNRPRELNLDVWGPDGNYVVSVLNPNCDDRIAGTDPRARTVGRSVFVYADPANLQDVVLEPELSPRYAEMASEFSKAK